MGNKMADGTARSNVSYYPGLANITAPEEKEPRSRILLVTDWIGLTMRKDPEHPNSWSLNPATVTLAIVVGGLLVSFGYLWGENVTERRNFMRQLDATGTTANRAIERADYAAGLRDKKENHGNTNTNSGGH